MIGLKLYETCGGNHYKDIMKFIEIFILCVVKESLRENSVAPPLSYQLSTENIPGLIIWKIKKFSCVLPSIVSQCTNQESNKVERYSKTNYAGWTGMPQGFQIYFVWNPSK